MDGLFSTLIVVFFFLSTEAFFSGSEYLLISFSRLKLKRLVDEGSSSARMLSDALASPERLFGATSIGTNISIVMTSAAMTAYMSHAQDFFDPDLISFAIIAPVTLILGEIVPKIIFREKADSLARYIAIPLDWSIRFFSPVLWVTSAIARGAARLFSRSDIEPVPMITREELLRSAKRSLSQIEMKGDERLMLNRILEFRGSTITGAMRPLPSLATISIFSTVRQAKAKLAESGFSRLPVYHDRVFNIVGVISAFKILRLDENLDDPIDEFIERPLYAPDTLRASTLLREMTAKGVHMAVALNEYGAAEGIVTLEDLLEEIVGEIEDEYDKPVKRFEKIAEGSWVVDASIEIDTLNDETELELERGEYETVNGLINCALERIPKKKSRFAYGRYLFTILDATPMKTISARIDDTLIDSALSAPVGGGDS